MKTITIRMKFFIDGEQVSHYLLKHDSQFREQCEWLYKHEVYYSVSNHLTDGKFNGEPYEGGRWRLEYDGRDENGNFVPLYALAFPNCLYIFKQALKGDTCVYVVDQGEDDVCTFEQAEMLSKVFKGRIKCKINTDGYTKKKDEIIPVSWFRFHRAPYYVEHTEDGYKRYVLETDAGDDVPGIELDPFMDVYRVEHWIKDDTNADTKQLLETYENEINSFDLHYLLTDDTIEKIGLDKVVEELEHYKYLADGIEDVLNYYPDEDFRNKKSNEFYDYMSGDGEYQTGDEDHVISYFYEKWDEEWEQILNERRI